MKTQGRKWRVGMGWACIGRHAHYGLMFKMGGFRKRMK